MDEKNNNKEKIIEKTKTKKEASKEQKSQIHPLHRLLFFIAFITLSFLFNIVAIALVQENFKYKTFYLKMFSFFLLCLFPITEYDKMKSIMIFLPSIVLLFFHVNFIPLSPMFLSLISFFTKIYSLAYLRIWIDQFAMIKYKTLLIYILNIFSLSGDKISMVITKYIKFSKIASNIVIVEFLIFVVFFLIPNKFFFIHNKISHYREIIKIDNKDTEDKKENEEKIKNKENKIELDSVSVFINYEIEENAKNKKNTKNAKFHQIYQIFLNPCYLSSILGKASLFFLIALLDYALIDYCSKVMSNEEKAKIFDNYEIWISIMSISGSIFGGVISIFFGGYEEIFSCLVVSISDLIIIITCFYLAYSQYFLVIFISLYLTFFSINVIMGNIEGFIIKSIPLKYKELGLNFSGLLSTIGCFLARNIYDYIKITFEKTSEFFAWRFCICCYLVGFFVILLACTYRYRDIIKNKKIKEKKIKKGTEMDDVEWEEDLENNNIDFKFMHNNIRDNFENSRYKESFDENSIDFNIKSDKFNSRKTFDSITS